MTGNDIIKNALKYKNYVYWYGGKGQKCTTDLLNILAKRYPSVYTAKYKAKCMSDIIDGKYCIDCSGLVCKAYEIEDVGTYQMATDKRFSEYSDKTNPLNGMIVWKWTHAGIYYNGKVIEARGVDYDVTANRVYRPSEWQRVLYFKDVDYMNKSKTPIEYLNAAITVINGKYGTGEKRYNALKAAGYDPDKVQNLVNLAMR